MPVTLCFALFFHPAQADKISHPRAFIAKGDLYAERNQAKQALHYYFKTAQLPIVDNNALFQRIAVFKIARIMANSNRPQQALAYYQQAFEYSNDFTDKAAALQGIAKMQFWLGQYVRAERTYRLLLSYPLSPTEHELALAGLVKSLAYYDRPRRAYRFIPSSLSYKTPELVIAASQASLWSDWADLTRTILSTYQPITKQLPKASALGRDLQDLQWQTNLATNPNNLTPSVFSSHDSEDFNKTRELLDYTHYWQQTAQTSVGLEALTYTQSHPHREQAEGLYLGQTLRPTRDIILHGQIEPMHFKNTSLYSRSNWDPLFWEGHGSYTPTDQLSFRLLALKEVIETFSAFQDKITDNQYATSVALHPLPYLEIDGAYSRLDMSDTNHRNVYFISSTALIMPSVGLSATGSLRDYTDRFTSPAYFSPHEYKAGTLLLRLGRRLGATWHYYLDGGVGRQYVIARPGSAAAGSLTYQWGLGITGPLSKCLVLKAYYADLHQASAFLDSKDYHYQYGGIGITLLL